MSRIQKISSSEIFDNFSNNMNKYLSKKNASWSTELLEKISDPGIIFNGNNFKNKAKLLEALKGMGKSIDDLIQELNSQGKSIDEIAQLTGRNVDDLKKKLNPGSPIPEVVEQAIPDVSKIKTDVTQISKNITDINNALVESSNAVKVEAKELIGLTQKSSDLTGKSLDEVTKLYEDLKRSRASIKGQVTKLKSELERTKELSKSMTGELAKKDELILAAEQLYKNTEKDLITLGKKVQELGGQLDDAGNIIKGLRNELDVAKVEIDANKQSIDLANKTIKELTEQGIQLSVEKQKLLSEAIKASEIAGYYKSIYEEAFKNSGAENISSKVALDLTTKAEKESAKLIDDVIKDTPAAAKAIDEAKSASKKLGSGKAKKEILEQEKKLSPINGPLSQSQKKSLLQKIILKSTPYMLGGVGKMISGGATIAGTGIIYALKFLAITSLFGGGAYLAWSYFFKNNESLVNENIKEAIQEQENLLLSLKNLRFKPGAESQNKVVELTTVLSKSLERISLLQNPSSLTERTYSEIMSDLDNLELSLDNVIGSKKNIILDLEDGSSFDNIVLNLTSLKNKILSLKKITLTAMQSGKAGESEMERGINKPISKDAPNDGDVEQNVEQSKQHIPQIIKVLDQDIDIGKDSSPGFRSVAPRINEKILSTPEGKAFLDPDNVWGGWLPKSTEKDANGNISQNKSVDYLRVLKFLYLNKIFNLHDLRKFIKDNLPKSGRKRLSGWNEAIKHYSNAGKIKNNIKKSDFFTQKLIKHTNNSDSSVISNGIKLMNKKSDKISKEYYQGAMLDLEDQYAKSYYTGLKGMYDQKPEHTSVDYKSKYQAHKETGSDVIGESHPETITVADATGNGGVVENQIEQHRQSVDVAKSVPSGNFRSKHAWVLKNLIKLANNADEQGLNEASDLIDIALKELVK
jgi:hypothetical protein